MAKSPEQKLNEMAHRGFANQNRKRVRAMLKAAKALRNLQHTENRSTPSQKT